MELSVHVAAARIWAETVPSCKSVPYRRKQLPNDLKYWQKNVIWNKMKTNKYNKKC